MTTTAAPPRVSVSLLRAAPRWWPDLAGVAAGLTLLIVTALWVHDGGVRQLTAPGGDAITAAGRITGLWSADLLLLQVLLMARIPVAERAFGQDRLARWHRWVGFTSFWLMVAHIALITLGYAASAGTNTFAELWDMIVTYPGMLLATAGTALLILVVATSARAARRRLRYESWHLLHLYAYLGVGLALPHQLWTGADFLGSALATAYWWTLYGTAAGAVLAYRIILPAWRNARHRLVVSHVAAEGPGLTSVYLRGRRIDRLPVRAGQFFQWRFLDGPGWSRAHPYSLSATPHGDLLRITVKALGDGSARVSGLRPGTRALIEGPYGKLTGESYDGGPVVLLACGIGITPLLALLGELPYGPGEATLVYRARNKQELAFSTELNWFATHRGVRLSYVLGPRAGRPPSPRAPHPPTGAPPEHPPTGAPPEHPPAEAPFAPNGVLAEQRSGQAPFAPNGVLGEQWSGRAPFASNGVLGEQWSGQTLFGTNGVRGERRSSLLSWLPGHLAHVGDAEALRRVAPDIARSHVFVCGPQEWAEAARAAAVEAGVPAGRVHTELFAW